MNLWTIRWLLIVAVLWVFTYPSPAPLVYRPGEGWYYEPVGSKGEWLKSRAKDQLQVAKEAFDKKDYKEALRAARRTVSQWPLSDYAAEAQYMVGRCYEAKGHGEKAFKEYQKLMEKYPKYENYEEVVRRQFEIANLYLAGKFFRALGLVPLYRSMDKTADMYEKVIKNGPFTDIAPLAQMKIGSAHENKRGLFKKAPDYPMAVRAYERAADRYFDRKIVAADALYKAGLAYKGQAMAAEYDQNASSQAIATFTDFITLYPEDPRVPESKKIIEQMKTEQARGSFVVARYYEKRKRYEGAKIYYNEVLNQDPNSKYAADARKRLDELKKLTGDTGTSPATQNPPGDNKSPDPGKPEDKPANAK